MKLSLDLRGPNGRMWDLEMSYHNLPPEYVMEVVSTARAYANYISTLAGGAASGDKKYSVKFSYGAEAQPKTTPFSDIMKGDAEADNLLYSQAVAIQDAGIELLQKLQAGAHMEIASGQRK